MQVPLACSLQWPISSSSTPMADHVSLKACVVPIAACGPGRVACGPASVPKATKPERLSSLLRRLSLEQLFRLLGFLLPPLTPKVNSRIASRMICEDRMRGSIDQVEAVIHFEDDTEGMQQWDQQIAGLCQALDDILDSMSSKGIAIPVIGILPIRYYMQSLDKSYLQMWIHVIVVGAGG